MLLAVSNFLSQTARQGGEPCVWLGLAVSEEPDSLHPLTTVQHIFGSLHLGDWARMHYHLHTQ